MTKTDATVEVCTLAELERAGVTVVTAGGWPVAVFHSEGRVFALDNRCPHMGFPLHKGTVRDGILTCHWHHAKFDLAGGCTFDPFADDVTSFPVEVRDGVVYVTPEPVQTDRAAHLRRKLREGLEQRIDLVLAKAAIGLGEAGAARDVITEAALFGVRNRARGFSTGLTILSSMAGVLDVLDPADRPLALYHGVINVAASTANQPPNFDLDALDTSVTDPSRYLTWFRHFVETRSADAAERTLRTAVARGLPREDVEAMVFAACTDHLYIDVGHALDMSNKAFELLDVIGWEHAEEVVPSLAPLMTGARRMEESSAWRHPVDLVAVLQGVHESLDDAIKAGARSPAADWDGHRDLAHLILDGEPAQIAAGMLRLVRDGVPLTELSATVAYAGALRAAYFSTTNEFGDWDTVHHAFTYANGVDQALRRAAGAGERLLARGIFDAAMAVWLERYLNVPKRPVPSANGRSATRADLLQSFDVQGNVDRTAALVVGFDGDVIAALGHALLREDSGFHEFQIYEAAVRQHAQFAGRPEAQEILVGAARFLTAHSPTVRASLQTYEIAARLGRREVLYGDID